MDQESSVSVYFDAQAACYDRRSRSGIWQLVRAREEKVVFQLLGPLIGKEILELGCGTGHYSELMVRKGAKVFGVDSSPNMLEELKRKGIEGRCAEISRLRLGRRFHGVLAAGVLEFMQDEKRLFAVARQHLLPGGRLVLLVPRGGLMGRIYEGAHSWMGCTALARSTERLVAVAQGLGFAHEAARGAGPLAKVLSFTLAREDEANG